MRKLSSPSRSPERSPSPPWPQELPPINAAPPVASSPAPAPAPSSATVAAPVVADRRRDVVREYVLYRGAFDDENKQALYSDEERGLVELHRLEALRDAQRHGYSRPTLSMSCREVTYPLDARGKRQALGSTCVETEVGS